MTPLRLVGRLLLIAFVLPVAIATGAFALLVAAVLDPAIAPLTGAVIEAGFQAFLDAAFALDDPHGRFGAAASGFGRLALALLVLPPAFVALTAEIVGARGFLWHVGGTALLTGAVPWLLRSAARAPTPEETHVTLVLALVGAAAGFVYWLFAGQWAGRARPLPAALPLPSGSRPGS